MSKNHVRHYQSSSYYLPPREACGLEIDYQVVTRDENIRVSQGQLALLLRHHGENPPDRESQKAVERIRQQCFKPKMAREYISTTCEEVIRIDTENRLFTVESDRVAREKATARRRKILTKIERVRGVGRQFLRQTVNEILDEVAEKHGLTTDDLIGRCRRYSAARHEAIWRCIKQTNLSSTRVGLYFDRDHTTILNSVKVYEEIRRTVAQGEAA